MTPEKDCSLPFRGLAAGNLKRRYWEQNYPMNNKLLMSGFIPDSASLMSQGQVPRCFFHECHLVEMDHLVLSLVSAWFPVDLDPPPIRITVRLLSESKRPAPCTQTTAAILGVTQGGPQ